MLMHPRSRPSSLPSSPAYFPPPTVPGHHSDYTYTPPKMFHDSPKSSIPPHHASTISVFPPLGEARNASQSSLLTRSQVGSAPRIQACRPLIARDVGKEEREPSWDVKALSLIRLCRVAPLFRIGGRMNQGSLHDTLGAITSAGELQREECQDNKKIYSDTRWIQWCEYTRNTIKSGREGNENDICYILEST